MGSKRLILHIGMHKTGTSSLQFQMNAQREALAEAGFWYARTDRGPQPEQPKHNSLYEALIGPDAEFETERDILRREFAASGCDALVLSAEGLSSPTGWTPRALRRVARLGEGMEIEAICYLRRQDTWLESLWNQRAKIGRTTDFIADYLRQPIIQRHMDYRAMLAAWGTVAKLTVLGFESSAKSGLSGSFARATGMPLFEEGKRNVSPTMATAAMLVALSRAGMTTGAWRAVEAILDPAKARPALGATLRADLLASLAEDHAALKADYGVEFPTAMPEEPDAPLGQPDAAELERVMAILSVMKPAKSGRPSARKGKPGLKARAGKGKRPGAKARPAAPEGDS